MHIYLLKTPDHRITHQDMVDVLPSALIFIGSLRPVIPHGTLRDVMQPLTMEIGQQCIVIPIVEVTRHDDSRIRMKTADGINGGHQPFAHYAPVRARLPLTAKTARSMYHKYVECIAADDFAAGI